MKRFDQQFNDYGIIENQFGDYCLYSDYKSLESELAETKRKLEYAEAALIVPPPKEGTYPWAIVLQKTITHAQYWIDSGRKELDRHHAFMCIEQAVNSWKNACCSYAEKCHNLEAKLEAAEQRIRESQEQEPVCHVVSRDNCTVWWNDKYTSIDQAPKRDTPLYAIPPIPNTEKE